MLEQSAPKLDVFGIKKLFIPRSTMIDIAPHLRGLLNCIESKSLHKSKKKGFVEWLVQATSAIANLASPKTPAGDLRAVIKSTGQEAREAEDATAVEAALQEDA